ncbi:Nnf1-domain-containing protein [Tirmania nivea]|nr:Nnf1-domain-containing protein [Tirmania nivea]
MRVSPLKQSNLPTTAPIAAQMSDPVPSAGVTPFAPTATDPLAEPAQPESTAPPPPVDEQSPGIRARAFREVLKRALNQTLKGCTQENIGQCFPTAAKHRPGLIKDVHKQLVGQYEKLATASFESVLARYDTIRKLNELDVLIDEARARKATAAAEGVTEEPIPPSTLPPTAILDAHLTPHLLKAQALLSEKLTTVQAENELLMDTIEKQEAEIRTLVTQLEKAVGGVEGAVKIVRGCVEEGKGEGEKDEQSGGENRDVEMVDA